MAVPQQDCIRCLFCQTGKEDRVVARIREAGLGEAFHPRRTKPLFHRGQWEDAEVSLLPGYVFVFTDEAVALNTLRALPDVIRPLTYGPEDQTGALFGPDRALALWLLQQNGLVGKLDAVLEGGQVRIVGGLLRSQTGRVMRIDRRKRLVHVELEVVGSIHSVWLGLNFLENLKDPAQEQLDG